jgi:hypothetical protein
MDNLEVNKIVNKILKLKKEPQTQKVKEQIQKLQQKLTK